MSISAQFTGKANPIFDLKYANIESNMKIIILVFLASGIVTLATAQSTRPKDDTAKMKTALTNFFNGIETQDFEKLKMATTTNFVLYEDGLVWNLDSAFMNIKRHMPFKAKYQLTNLKIYADGHSGDATYSNHVDFVFTSGNLSLDWIESATFRKINGDWKINFMQVTIKK